MLGAEFDLADEAALLVDVTHERVRLIRDN